MTGQPSTQPAEDPTLDLGNSVMMKLVLIPAGKLMMGSTKSEQDESTRSAVAAGVPKESFSFADEGPQREVSITRPFYMGTYEITRGQFAPFATETGYKTDAEKEGWAFGWTASTWDKVNGASWRSPGFEQTDNHPVVCVSHHDAVAFCAWLSTKTGRAVRLPTEAQWEYACRGGTSWVYPWGDSPDAGRGWCNAADQTGKEKIPFDYIFNWADGYVFTAPVGNYRPNGFGLYDVIGNVSEWCSDWYADSYANANNQDPRGAASGSFRVLRGGGWDGNPAICRSSLRFHGTPAGRSSCLGFRVAVDLK